MIFHILVSIFGVFLQFSPNILINIFGIVIIYQHLLVIYTGCKRLPEFIIILGSFTGALIGLQNKKAFIYIPFIYSFLSKVPTYVSNMNGQIRTIYLTIIISMILGHIFGNRSLRVNTITNRKKKTNNNKKNNPPLSIKMY